MSIKPKRRLLCPALSRYFRLSIRDFGANTLPWTSLNFYYEKSIYGGLWRAWCIVIQRRVSVLQTPEVENYREDISGGCHQRYCVAGFTKDLTQCISYDRLGYRISDEGALSALVKTQVERHSLLLNPACGHVNGKDLAHDSVACLTSRN